MSKKDSLLQHGRERINKELMPQEWNDDSMHMSDNNSMEYHGNVLDDLRGQVIDANSIDDFSEMQNIPVMDRNGRIKGFRTEVKRKSRKR